MNRKEREPGVNFHKDLILAIFPRSVWAEIPPDARDRLVGSGEKYGNDKSVEIRLYVPCNDWLNFLARCTTDGIVLDHVVTVYVFGGQVPCRKEESTSTSTESDPLPDSKMS